MCEPGSDERKRIEAEAAAQERARLLVEVGEAFDALAGMWSWHDATIEDVAAWHGWVGQAGRKLRAIVGRPSRDPFSEPAP